MMATPIIIDCDPGTDDAIALLFAFASRELNVLAVTVVGGNAGLEHTLPNALALTRLAGSSAPVHPGADRPLLGSFTSVSHIHGETGLGGVLLPQGGPPSPELAADAIRRLLHESREPVTLVGIGPATNLALALMTEPAVLSNVAQIVLMTGAWGEGNITPAAEFNAWSDPEALAVLLSCGRPVVMATLEVTAQALATPARIAAWRQLGHGACLRAACDIQASVPLSRRYTPAGAPLHDPCALAWLVNPTLFTSRPCAVTMDLTQGPSRGRTVVDRWGRTDMATNALVLETCDGDGLFALLGERLARLP
jgi:inosine-uridine nucleoside N-ribohydrolase